MVAGIDHLAGITLATVTAIAFAFYFICVRLGTDKGRVLDIVLVSLIANVVLIVPLVAIFHGVPHISRVSFFAFVAAGLSGSLLARLLVAKSIEAIGASRTSPIVASNVFFASVFAIVLFDEQITGFHVIGIVLIVAGVALISWESAQDATGDMSIRSFGPALLLPVSGALFIGIEPIFVTIGLDAGGPILPGVAIKAIAATLGFLLYLTWTQSLRRDILRWDQDTKWYLGAGITSSIGIIAYFAALEIAPVVIVVPLIQTSPLVVVILSALFLPKRLEYVTIRLILAACIVVIGAAMVSVFG